MQVDSQANDAYLAILVADAPALGAVLADMAAAAGSAARSRQPSDMAKARSSLSAVMEQAQLFLDHLAGAGCPEHLRGADEQLQDALKLQIDGARRGIEAVDSSDAARLESAASEIDVANRDVVLAAGRIAEWRSGAAKAQP